MATHGLPVWPWTEAEADALPAPERLVVDAARAWAAAAHRREPPVPALQRLMATEDAAHAAPALDGLLRALANAHPLTLGCPLCPRLIGDEPALLLSVAMAQRGSRGEALATLLRRLPPPHAYAAMGAAISLAVGLRRVGLLLADPWKPCPRG